jgi:Domain of unknown function (DUF4871)
MEKELKNLRKAMNSTTHKGIRFTEIQKERIRASLHQEKNQAIEKPKIFIYLITSLAASMFALLFYTDLLANLSSKDSVKQGATQTLESEWKVRNEYSKNGKVVFNVFPDPYLSAGKPFGFIFSFKEPFVNYKGKELEIYAIHKETGERINVLPSRKITEPSSGYSTLGRYTTTLSVPKDGLWKYEVYFNNKLYGDVVLSVGNIPNFVDTSVFQNIDWNRKAVYINNNILGNENKSGVIGADMPSINSPQKWMWHLWGIENPKETKLTVVGFHKETETVHQVLTTGWSISLGGAINGADAHTPSSVNLPLAGKWAMLLYVDGKLFDVLVYNINH